MLLEMLKIVKELKTANKRQLWQLRARLRKLVAALESEGAPLAGVAVRGRRLEYAESQTNHIGCAKSIMDSLGQIVRLSEPEPLAIATMAILKEAGVGGLTRSEMLYDASLARLWVLKNRGLVDTNSLPKGPKIGPPASWWLTEQGISQFDVDCQRIEDTVGKILSPKEQQEAYQYLNQGVGSVLPKDTPFVVRLMAATGVAHLQGRRLHLSPNSIDPSSALVLDVLNSEPTKQRTKAELAIRGQISQGTFNHLVKQGLITRSEIPRSGQGPRQEWQFAITEIGQQAATDLASLPSKLAAVGNHQDIRVGAKDGIDGFAPVPLLLHTASLSDDGARKAALLVAKLADGL